MEVSPHFIIMEKEKHEVTPKALKTLREIEKCGLNKEFIYERDLRAEAVKWVKDMKSNGATLEYGADRDWLHFACIRFEEFFNLTEEELG